MLTLCTTRSICRNLTWSFWIIFVYSFKSHNCSWDLTFLLLWCQTHFPPQTASHCTHQLFKVLATAPNYSSPHQTRSSGHANGGFLFSCLPSFGQPSSVMLLLLFFFSSLWKIIVGFFFSFLFFFSPPILFPAPPVCQSVILCASTKPSVLITWWKRSQVYLLPGWGSRSEDKPEGREEAAVVELGGWCWWVNHLCILITSLCGACIQPAVWGGATIA